MRRLIALFVVSVILGAGFSVQPAEAAFTPSTAGKKLIQYGWDCPNTAFVREHIREMEGQPFDGIVIRVTKSREPKLGGTDSLGWKTFSTTRFQPADYEQAIADLKAATFTKFTDNFIQLITAPGIDWFDAQWDAVAHNARILAKVAKEGGCVGLMVDPEQYPPMRMWTYAGLPAELQALHTREQYIEKARLRGEEFIQAINSEFPDIKILGLFGPSFTAQFAKIDQRYDLLLPFYEGMCRAATTGTEIIDGYEQSYAYNRESQFVSGRNAMLVLAREYFIDKTAFDRVMRAGFGLWMDYDSTRRGWFPNEPAKNYFSVESWQTAIYYSLAYTDRYVWVYNQQPNWWTNAKVGQGYKQAQIDGCTAPTAP